MTEPSHSPADLVLDADAARRRRAVYAIIIAAAAGLIAASILVARPLQSANDRSRWCTVWSIVEENCYAIDTIIQRPGWDTIDKVRFHDHFYSTKPALLPTLVAGVYWCVKRATGWNLLEQTADVTRAVLMVVNWLPMIVLLVVVAAIVERYARRDLTRYFVLVTAAVGTLLTTFLVTLNNHTIAAACLVLALYPALRIVVDGSRRPLHFALCGFFAALTCTSELPAALFGLSTFFLLVLRAPAATLKFFVPAALLPLSAFFATTYLASGDWRPFYVFFGQEPYNYVFEGIPSYWSNPSGLDANREPWYVYLLHCTIGHHGILSLSPVWLFAVAGWIGFCRRPAHPLRPFLWMGLGLTTALLAFYVSRTGSYNYGGNTSGLRWTFWLIPFWLLAIIPVLDRWADCRWTRLAAVLCLSVSVFSAAYPQTNPWQHPWLFQLMTRWGWIDYREKIADFDKPLMTWFSLLPNEDNGGREYWTTFDTLEVNGTQSQRTLRDGGAVQAEDVSQKFRNRSVRKFYIEEGSARRGRAVKTCYFDSEMFFAGTLFSRRDDMRQAFYPGTSLLHGLPTLRKSGYRRGKVRYLKTKLRRDAFRCRHAAGQVAYRPPGENRTLTYRTDLWLCPEVPFGVLRVESSIYDKATGNLIGRRQMTAAAVGKLLPRHEE